MCAPSKYYSYLQGGLPILAVAEQSSYLSKDVLYSEIGLCSDVGNGVQLTQNILQLYQDPETVQKNVRQCSETIHGKVCKGHRPEQVCRLVQERITHGQLRNCFS